MTTIQRLKTALENIQANAATKPNGGAWAAGIATLCLATDDKPAMTDNNLGKVDIQKLMQNTDSPYVKAIWNAAIEAAIIAVTQTPTFHPVTVMLEAVKHKILELKR